jgi:hypothetical protein
MSSFSKGFVGQNFKTKFRTLKTKIQAERGVRRVRVGNLDYFVIGGEDA